MRNKDARLAATVAALLAGAAFAVVPAFAEPLPRAGAVAGAVIARKSGEEARFIEIGDWRTVDLRQDLLPGDVLRTNASGNLAILFSDRTQVRLGRNSTLVVRKVGGSGEDTELALEAGQLWARAERGGEGVAVETPAATAAIRGTDWSMQVDGGGKTSLIVLEGTVELANAQGSVTVNQGEGASAAIGQAPTRLAIVNPDDRAQMLYYYSLRNAFAVLPSSTLRPREGRREFARITALPEGARTAEDWTVLAEIAGEFGGTAAVEAALSEARARHPSRAQTARLDLVEALIAGSEGRDAEAAALFRRAAAGLKGERRASALYGGYFARALAEPNHAEAPPRVSDGGVTAVLGEALTAAFLQDLPAALAVLSKAETRFPDEAALPAGRARLGSLLDDRAQVREGIERALALDPDDATALLVRAEFRADVESDLEGALADARRLTELSPGWSTAWNTLGLIQIARGAEREAEAALLRAIALEPGDAVSLINYSILLLEQDRIAEARAAITKALAADPSYDIGLVARGRLELQAGQTQAALQDLLAGSTANPAYSQGLLLLAGGYYEAGQRDAAEQALENADRLDPDDPATTSFETAIAIDAYDSDRAIASAQESLRRARARGGDFASLGASRDQGSTLNEAYRQQGLDAWGRYYGDAVFDPFSAAALTDQSVSGSPDPFLTDADFGGQPTEPTFNNSGFSTFFQGLLLDPASLAGRSRSANLFRRPFLEGAVGAGFVAPERGDTGWRTELEAQGFAAAPFPVSVYGSFMGREAEEFREGAGQEGIYSLDTQFNLADEDFSGTGYIAAKPTPVDRVVAYVDGRNDGDRLDDGFFDYEPGPPLTVVPVPNPNGGDPLPLVLSYETVAYDRDLSDRSLTAGIGLSHTFGYRNVASAGLFASGFERSSEETGTIGLGVFTIPGVLGTGIAEVDGAFNQRELIAAASHAVGFGDVTLRYGAEGGRVEQEQSERRRLSAPDITPNVILTRDEYSADLLGGQVYVDALYEITPTLKAEAALFGTFLGSDDVSIESTTENGGPTITPPGALAPAGGQGDTESEAADGDISTARLEPRLGLSWEPVPGQLLRVGFLRQSGAFTAASLAPVGVVGLQANQLPVSVTGVTDTFAARWEAEWTSRLFTAVDFQHQSFDGLNIPEPGGITTIDLEEGRLDRVSATVNYHLGAGLGLFGTLALTDSESETEGPGLGDPLPFVPDLLGRAGVTWVSPLDVKATVAATRVGERRSGLGGSTLDPYWTLDAAMSWEPFSKRFDVELAGYNLLGEDFNVSSQVPGWGRTFTGSLKVRF